MTKADVFTAGAGGDHVANLDVAIGDNHPINQQLHQLPLLGKGGVFHPSLDPLAKRLDGDHDTSRFLLVFYLARALLGLSLQHAHLLLDRLAPPLILGQGQHATQVGHPSAVLAAARGTSHEDPGQMGSGGQYVCVEVRE